MTFAEFPFLRYLAFYVLGIFLSNILPAVDAFTILELLGIAWLLYVFILTRLPETNTVITPVLAYSLLLGLGAFVEAYTHPPTEGLGVNWGSGEGYLGEVQRFDLRKENSSENLLAVIAVKDGENWNKQEGLVLVYHSSEIPFFPGQVLWVPKNPESLEPPTFPNEFDYKGYLAGKGIYFRQFLGTTSRPLPLHKSFQLKFSLAYLRNYFFQVIDRYLFRSDTKQIALALLLGQKEALSKEVKQAYSAVGVQHVLAVSGLHVGIIYSLLLLPISFLKQEGKALGRGYLLLVMGLIWIYALITGFSPSVVRAVVMFSLVSLGQLRKTKPSIWNTLSFSALLMLVIDPGLRTDLGFQLSYVAVSGIVGLQPLLLRLWSPSNRIVDYFWQMAAVSVAAQLITSPLTIHYFHVFPSYFLLANLLIVPLTYGIICVGIPFLLVAWIPILGKVLGALLEFLLLLQNEATYFIQNLPAASWQGLHLSIVGMLAVWGLLWVWGNWEFGNRKRLAFLGLGLCVLWTCSNLWEEMHRPAKELYLFTQAGKFIIDLKLGTHHLSWNQNFPIEQIAYSIQPNRQAERRNPTPMPMKGMVSRDSIWFPGIDLVFFPATNQLVWRTLIPRCQEQFSSHSNQGDGNADEIFTSSAGVRAIF